MTIRFSPDDVARFAAWSADRNPLHVDASFARGTHFGRPIVHGVLTVLEAFRSGVPATGSAVTALDIEFRGAVVTGEDYVVSAAAAGDDLGVSLRGAGATVLDVRASVEPPDTAAFETSWLHSSSPAPIRDHAAARGLDEFERGIDVIGTYPIAPTLDSADAASRLSATQARVLALCSYVTGMEVPGLRSLFMRISVRFHEFEGAPADLRYRARTIRFDRQFRLLDTELQVVTPEGVPVATALLRGYVPFSPLAPDIGALASWVSDAASLKGSVALVVGASRGLGADIAAGLSAAGCHVYASARRAGAEAEPWVQELRARGAAITFLEGDAGDEAWAASTADMLASRHGRLDVLVLNACEPPRALRLSADSAAPHAAYVRDNLRLFETPLAASADLLDRSAGRLVCVSSSFVDDTPVGFGHYVAVKQAAEGLTRTICRERPRISGLIVRPPVLQTRWNDTPAGVVGSFPSDQAAAHIVTALARDARPGHTATLTDFPALQLARAESAAAAPKPALALRLAATFTTDPLVAPLQFWLRELGFDGEVQLAPYGQVLQALLDPGSVLNTRTRGLNVVCLRVRDWVRELADEQAGDIEFVRTFLQDTLRDFERAMRAHRAQAPVETLLIVCPSHGALSSAESILIRQLETGLGVALADVPGLQLVDATAFHGAYGVDEDDVYDGLRDEIAHIPYRDDYFHVLATIMARHLHRRTAPPRKVVVVDCDNTLWRGVVGEVGAEGVVFDEGHTALHQTLSRLSASGVLVCLCSKNEESDVWRVFETRSELMLPRERVVAAMVNWLPKSQNIRTLAARLNLGLDSFVFIDDNPVECAEVRAGCPDVLTIQWPDDAGRAVQLLQHVWEFDARTATNEDARRTDMYREEFRRQELRAETLTFEDFIHTLQLEVDFAPLAAEDLRRAAQLTLRTNQFNFTTIRREEADLQALVSGGRHEIRTVRVRDRFGDYGLVGLLIAERDADVWTLDTFLLSCRVLGRGAEHHIMAQLGQLAASAGARVVKVRIETTKRNQPARSFLEAVVAPELLRSGERGLEADVPADTLAAIRFEPAATGEVIVQDDGAGQSSGQIDPAHLRRREEQIVRAAFELSTGRDLRAVVEGRPAPAAATAAETTTDDIAAVVHTAFATALRLPAQQVAELDQLEVLGCDSLKIVEITVALSQTYPSMPGTLLFEHRSVSAIVKEIAALNGVGAVATTAGATEARIPASAKQHATTGEIAVVGLHVRTAGANSPAEFWDLLSRGASAVTPVPENRQHFLQPLADTRRHWAGLIDDPARFDAELFGVSPREAEFMDPQLRLFLEVAWSALEDAGCFGEAHEPGTGVFAGVMYGDYGARANVDPSGNSNAYRCWEGFSLANRLSQLLGFSGPSLAVDTACSSSGTAIHLACGALNAGDCRVAVVGGVNLILDPDRFASLGRLGILSERGRCEPFGADADGTVLGEGAGVVVLRPLDDALRRGDRIYGVIKGTGLSTGNGTVGFTAPNPHAQAEAIRRGLSRAGIDPRTVSYIETHGTGTHLGDPIEVRGLTLGYGAPELQDDSLALEQRSRIGSVKPNIGHLEAGAGLVGLIKVLLQLHHGVLLPSITSSEPNPQILFARGTFDVQTALEPWPRLTARRGHQTVTIPRRAGVSSFGVGGANAHIVVEEAPVAAEPSNVDDRPMHLLALSGRTEAALQRQVVALERFVSTNDDVTVSDLCFSVNTGRKHLSHRLAIAATTREELHQALMTASEGGSPKRGARGVVTGGAPRIAFLFTGQGSQYAGMGRQLYASQPVFRGALDQCAALFDRLLDRPLLDLLFAEEGSADGELLNQTGYTQPALFAFQYALARMWASWGIHPDVVLGHSVGEIAALCVAGGVSLEDGSKLIAARGRLMQALPAGGTMTSVMADESRVLAAIAGAEELVAIAAINAPGQVVISGDGVAVAEIAARLTADGIKTKSLTVSHAFHSPLMRPMLAEFERVVREIRFSPPRVPFVSCVEGGFVQDEVTRPDYWIRQVLDPVRFAAGMQVLERDHVTAYVEAGPHPVLLGMGRQCVSDDGGAVWLPSARRDGDAWQTVLTSVATLYAQGAALDWRGFDQPYHRLRRSVPGYEFAAKPYWLKRVAAHSGSRPAPSAASDRASAVDTYEITWRQASLESPAKVTSDRPWIILADSDGVSDALAHELRAAGAPVTVVERGGAVSLTGQPSRVVYLGSLDRLSTAGAEEIGREATDTLAVLTDVVQRLAAGGAEQPSLWMVTRGAVSVDEGRESVTPVQALQWGFGRTVSLEHPGVWGGLIDIDNDSATIAALAQELLAAGSEDQVALRATERFVPRLVRRLVPSDRRPAWSADGTYLVTGGTGALGLRAAEWLVARGARHLTLTSRRGLVDDAARARIQSLETAGAAVTVVAADIARARDVETLLQRIAAGGPPLRGIVHAAGVDAVVPLQQLSLKDIEDVVSAKVIGAQLLHERTQSLALDCFICFSSMSSVFGSQGRAHYSAANAFLDGLAAERRRLGLPATSIAWGPWKGGGMAAGAHLEQFARAGNHGLDPDRAIAALDAITGADLSGISVMDVDWPVFAAVYAARRPRPLLGEVTDAVTETPAAEATGAPETRAPATSPWIAALREVPGDARDGRLASLLREEIADTLGFDDVGSVPLDRNFYELGMDSLMMADLVGRLKKRTGVSCTDLAFNKPNIAALTPALLSRLEIDATVSARPAAEVAPEPGESADSATPASDGFDPAEEAEILAFQKLVFPRRQESWVDDRWRWMFLKSAERLGVPPRFWLHRDAGRIVGQTGSIAVKLKVGDQHLDTGWLVDSMVLPEYRSRAVGSRLLVEAHEDQPFSLSLGQTAEVREILYRLGWKQIAPLQIAQLLVRPERVLKGKLPAPAAWMAAVGMRASTAVRDVIGERTRLNIRRVERFDARHDELWAGVADQFGCAVVRDASYLNWKYVDQPGQQFVRVELSDDRGLRAVAVWQLREPDPAYQYRRALLVDLVAPMADPQLLTRVIKSAAGVAAEEGADALLCHHIDARLTAALRAAAFHLRQPERFLLVDPGPLSGTVLQQVLKPSNWFVTQGDSDIDRPW
jgi:FkbH-like protein